MTVFNAAFLLLCFALFALRRLLRYLHIFQQEEYDVRRFLPWLARTLAFDKKLSAALVIFWLLGRGVHALAPLCANDNFLAALFALFAVFEADPRKVAKKKLVVTQRAQRIFGIALVFCLAVGWGVSEFHLTLLWILAAQFIPLSLVLANLLLMPVEAHIQKRIMREAFERLKQINPTVIGITGSFGKTSVKHILGHILEMNAPTLYTPGSVNTLMGISRIIREKLQASAKFFLVEMGAYGVGSIKRLCDLTPPHMGIITALGEAHYERFKSLDAVAHAKFELAEAVLADASGKVIIHDSVLAQAYAKSFVEKQRDRFIVCGSGADVDLKIGAVEQTSRGLNVAVEWRGQSHVLFAPLFGLHHAGNMALAFAAALAVGVAPDRAAAALRTVPQIKHRLEVKAQSDGTIYIDDGFNSNPKGFLSALELLSRLAAEKKTRRVLITPGIVELGAKHDEVHAMLGGEAAKNADIALVVRADHIPTFVAAFQAAAPQKILHPVANLAEALSWLKQNGQTGDVILIENDLPDLGEARLVL